MLDAEKYAKQYNSSVENDLYWGLRADLSELRETDALNVLNDAMGELMNVSKH